jgi:nitroreductase/NAD-dependent dihydropyrimidine dehydrogenase PreA subunit
MKQVSIDYETCTKCLLCVQTQARCFSKRGDTVVAEADENTCVLCGHCVGFCPSESITHHTMDMNNFPEVGKRHAIDADDFTQLIRERRSHRAFLNKPVPRKDLERLIDTVRYAPTGHNDQTVEIVLVQNPGRRKVLSNLAVDFMAAAGKGQARKLAELKASGTGTPEAIAQLTGGSEFMGFLAQARDEGRDPLLYEAPIVAIFHSPTKSVTPKDNCVIAATTMGLFARTLGLETTYIALFEAAANAHEPLKKELGLPEGHRVFSVLVMGYPRVKYLRAVDRKPIKTRWE